MSIQYIYCSNIFSDDYRVPRRMVVVLCYLVWYLLYSLLLSNYIVKK